MKEKKKIDFKDLLILSPMAGYTDVGFRKICVDYGADYTVTEMVSAKGLYYGDKKTEKLLRVAENEKIKCCQLFGREPEIFKEVVKLPILEKFDIIDINMGCPAPKIFNNREGSYLLQDMETAEKVIRAVVENTDKYVTVKFRLGINEENINAVEFAKMCERAGADAICVHGRTREQYYSGQCNLEEIQKVIQAVKIPVIANGDVRDLKSYQKMKEIGASSVMIGRGALGNPQIFSILKGKSFLFDRFSVMSEHLNLLSEVYDERTTVFEFRKHVVRYVKNKELRNKFMTATTMEELRKILLLNKEELRRIDDE